MLWDYTPKTNGIYPFLSTVANEYWWEKYKIYRADIPVIYELTEFRYLTNEYSNFSQVKSIVTIERKRQMQFVLGV